MLNESISLCDDVVVAFCAKAVYRRKNDKLLPLMHVLHQKQQLLPFVHCCLWCCNSEINQTYEAAYFGSMFFSGIQGL